MKVLIAEDAISAMSNAVSFNPDVAVIDINLPGGDGFMVAERLMSSNETSSISFFFMTATKVEGIAQKAANWWGALGFLENPFYSFQLTDMISSGTGSA